MLSFSPRIISAFFLSPILEEIYNSFNNCWIDFSRGNGIELLTNTPNLKSIINSFREIVGKTINRRGVDVPVNNVFGAEKLEIPDEKVIVTVDHHGNTSAASIPLALSAIGPRASIDTVVPTNDNIPSAEIAIP